MEYYINKSILFLALPAKPMMNVGLVRVEFKEKWF
jgi:hypothetical protein